MSTAGGPVSSETNEGDWSGRAEQLLQQQLKNVQEECRQLREAYRREDSSSRLSRHSRTNSTQSLGPSLGAKPATSPPSLTTPHHLTPSLSTPYMTYSSASLSSIKSTHSEFTPSAITSSRHHLPHPSRYTDREVYTTPRGEAKKKTGVAKKKNVSKSKQITSTISTNTPSYVPGAGVREGGGGGGRRQVTATPGHVLDSGYSSGSGVRNRTGDQPLFPGKSGSNTRWSGTKTALQSTLHASPPLSHPPPSATTTSVTIPATLHVTGRRGGGEAGEERERGKVRQLEHEVTVLEQQLAEKTQAARGHVEEVTCMRSELARERAALARERQESREAAGAQLRREKTAHKEQCRQLMEQLERLRGEKREGDREIGTLRASLKGNEAEVVRMTEVLSRLTQQLDRERESHASTTRSLHAVAEESRSKVAELEHALQACHNEITGHMTQLMELDKAHHSQVDSLNNKVSGLEEMVSGLRVQLQSKMSEVSELQSKIEREQSQHRTELQEKMDAMAGVQEALDRLRMERGCEMEGGRRREEQLQRSLEESETMRESLLNQIERNRQELEKMTSGLAAVQEREGEAEQFRAEAEQLRHMVNELQRGRREGEGEVREVREEQRRLQVQLGQTQAQLQSTSSQLQQARDRETEYSRATAELVKEAGQVRAESGRLKDRLEASEKEVEELRNEMKQRREAEQSNTSTLSQELATRGKQVLEMEQLLRRQQLEASSRRGELEKKLSQSQSDLRARTQQLEQHKTQLSLSQKTIDGLQGKVTQLQAQQNHSSDAESKLSSKETELALLRHQLKSLRESHSSVLASSEQLASTHLKAEAEVAEQLRVRQEELSRTRAQVSSLSIELTAEKKTTEKLRSQLTLTRAEATRYQTQVSSMQRAASLRTIGASNKASISFSHLPPPSPAVNGPSKPHTRGADKLHARSDVGQKKGHVIDL